MVIFPICVKVDNMISVNGTAFGYFGIAVSVVGWVVVHCLAVWTDNKNRRLAIEDNKKRNEEIRINTIKLEISKAKNEFEVFILITRQKITPRDVDEFYKSTKSDINVAVSKLIKILSAYGAAFVDGSVPIRLSALWQEYDKINPQNLSNKNELPLQDKWDESGGENLKPPVELKCFLDRFLKIVEGV
jgi:hypothetical protein